MSDPEEQIPSVNIDLNVLYAALNARLQPCIDMVSFGLRAAVLGEVPNEPHTAMPGSNLDLHTGQPPSEEVLRERFCSWVLRGGVRDALEVVSLFVEHARFNASMIQLWREFQSAGSGDADMPPHKWNAVVTVEWQRFHRLGFPDKLDFMREHYGRDLLPEVTAKILTINSVRNCFVHRQGIVSDRDTNCDEGLRVRWSSMTPCLRDEDGIHPLVLGQRVAKESHVVLQFGNEDRLFQKGESLTFSAADFTNICWTFIEFGRQFCAKLNEYGLEIGCFRPPPSELPEEQP